jgi:hypothetical protein
MNEHVLKTKKYLHAACLLYVLWVLVELAATLGRYGTTIQVIQLCGVATHVAAAFGLRGIAFLLVDLLTSRIAVTEK